MKLTIQITVHRDKYGSGLLATHETELSTNLVISPDMISDLAGTAADDISAQLKAKGDNKPAVHEEEARLNPAPSPRAEAGEDNDPGF